MAGNHNRVTKSIEKTLEGPQSLTQSWEFVDTVTEEENCKADKNEQIGSISIDKADLPVLPHATLQDNGIKKITDAFDADLKRLMQRVQLSESTEKRTQTFASIDKELSKTPEDEELSKTPDDEAQDFVWINEELPTPTEEKEHTFVFLNKELSKSTEERVRNLTSAVEEESKTAGERVQNVSADEAGSKTTEAGSKTTEGRAQNRTLADAKLSKTTEKREQTFATTELKLMKTTVMEPTRRDLEKQTNLEEYFRHNDFSHVVPFEWHLENFSYYVETIHSPFFYAGDNNMWKAYIRLEKDVNRNDLILFFKLLTQPDNPVFLLFDLGLYNSRGEQIEKVLTGGWFGKIFHEYSCLRTNRPGVAIGNERPKVELHDDQLIIKGRIGFFR